MAVHSTVVCSENGLVPWVSVHLFFNLARWCCKLHVECVLPVFRLCVFSYYTLEDISASSWHSDCDISWLLQLTQRYPPFVQSARI